MALLGRITLQGLCGRKNATLHCNPFKSQWSRGVFTTSCVSAMKIQTAEDFWAKNRRLRRPTSPHLTIYKPQITSMLSISHRGTGLFLSAVMSGFSIGIVALPNSYPYYLNLVETMHYGGSLIFLAKFALAFPFMFHTCNGVRHLVWDLGYGFTLKQLYGTGYLVVAASILLSIGIALL